MDGKILFLLLMGVIALFMLSMYKRCQNPVLTMLGVTIMGILAHGLVYITGSITGVIIPINPYTLVCSSVLSVPGVIMMIVLGII